MSIEDKLREIRSAIDDAHLHLNRAEALVNSFIKEEKPSLAILERTFQAAEDRAR